MITNCLLSISNTTLSALECFIMWNPSEVALHLGPLSIRWYALCWLIGLGLAYIIVHRLFRQQKISDEKFEPLFIYCFFGILIGARLGHCFFYEPEKYLSSWTNFVEIFLPIQYGADGWHFTGFMGLASHGGTIGLIIALWMYVRKTSVPLWQVLDNIAIATPITACFIRLGNLMNSEIIGRPTNVAWAFVFEKVDLLPRHPGQLYEALAYLLFFFVMLHFYHYGRKTDVKGSSTPSLFARYTSGKVGTGFFFGLCLTLIFTARFFIEFTKENQVAFEEYLPLDMGQLLSLPFIVIGVYCMVKGKKKEPEMK